MNKLARNKLAFLPAAAVAQKKRKFYDICFRTAILLFDKSLPDSRRMVVLDVNKANSNVKTIFASPDILVNFVLNQEILKGEVLLYH